MHTPYEVIRGHKADFRVRYRFYTPEEGGRSTTITPYQGYRSDFFYEHPEHKPSQIFMIWPEFEDEEGVVVLENDKSVVSEGTARMWILIPEMRPYHLDKIYSGMKGWFMEGPRKVAECEVIEIIDLKNNPGII